VGLLPNEEVVEVGVVLAQAIFGQVPENRMLSKILIKKEAVMVLVVMIIWSYFLHKVWRYFHNPRL
jgi:hypothetical protein